MLPYKYATKLYYFCIAVLLKVKREGGKGK